MRKPIPVFVIVRDRYDQLVRTVERLEAADGIRIVLVDNASTYEPTIDYLRASPHQVHFLGQNLGHHAPWDANLVPMHQPFGVTDPDVRIADECPNDWPLRFLDTLQRHPELIKVGFGLRIDDLPARYFDRDHVIAHESQFWQDELERWDDGTVVYHAGVDTTLAIYPSNVGWEIWPSARTGYPYVAQHLAWYVDSNNLSEDEVFYRIHADRNVASWRYREDL